MLKNKQEEAIVLFLAFVIFGLNLFVWIQRIRLAPEGRDFIPIHNSLSDYPFYVSVIRQGLSGQIAVADNYAVEPHNKSYIHFLYLFFGWVGKLLSISSAHVLYHISRYILGGLWMLVIYGLARSVTKEKWIRAFSVFFALFSVSFPRLERVGGSLIISGFMSWWSEFDPVVRAAFVPHFLAGHIAMGIVWISVINATRNRPKWWNALATVASFFAAFVHPPSALILLLVIPIYCLIVRKSSLIGRSLLIFIGCGLGLLTIKYHSSEFPWILAKQYEGLSYGFPVSEYVLALGPVTILALIGAFARWHVKETWVFILWVIVSFVMVLISRMMPTSPIPFIRDNPVSDIRFLQTATWVPLGILGAFGLSVLWKRFGKRAGATVLGMFLVLTFVGYPAAIKKQSDHIFFMHDYTYPVVGYVEALKSLESLTRPQDVVLSLSLAGYTIPMYANRTAYVGQIIYTPDNDRKLGKSWDFLSGDMDICTAYRFVIENRIKIVLYSFDEQNAGDPVKFYPFVQLFHTYNTTKVYVINTIVPEGCLIQ